MKAIEIRKGVYWVGARDWNVRNFHGYRTQRGTTYNAYLVIDEKITLIDNVKVEFTNEMIARISSIIDPASIDVIVTNHIEPDHSGSLPTIHKMAPDAKIIASPIGKKGIEEMYGIADSCITSVKNGETLSIGSRTLKFIHMSMIHWPDSMLTYCGDDQIIFSNDAFGQHYCTGQLYSDQVPEDTLFYETEKYYANIVLPYGKQVARAIPTLSNLTFDMIAPSHGVIWNNNLNKLLEGYTNWCSHANVEEAVVVYDTMWKSTEVIARSIESVFVEQGIPVKVCNLQIDHYSDVITAVMRAKYVCIGSATLNGEVMPSVAAFLCYMRGLKPLSKRGLAFGSYGWNKNGFSDIETVMEHLQWDIPNPIITSKGRPHSEVIEEVEKAVSDLIQK